MFVGLCAYGDAFGVPAHAFGVARFQCMFRPRKYIVAFAWHALMIGPQSALLCLRQVVLACSLVWRAALPCCASFLGFSLTFQLFKHWMESTWVHKCRVLRTLALCVRLPASSVSVTQALLFACFALIKVACRLFVSLACGREASGWID